MASRGVHFSLDADEVAVLRAVHKGKRVAYVQETLENELWSSDASCAQETDKAWDAIHRSFAGGALRWDNGDHPLSQVILGGELLYRGGDYILSLKSPEQVGAIADAVRAVTKDKLRAGYYAIDRRSYGLWHVPLRGGFPIHVGVVPRIG
jgi:hypothetical protein